MCCAVTEGVILFTQASAFSVERWAMRPRLMITFTFFIAAMSSIRNCRQVLISADVGLFCGGTQRTALTILIPCQRDTIIRISLVGAAAQIETIKCSEQQITGKIAGKGPVLLAPRMPGARPTSRIGASTARNH